MINAFKRTHSRHHDRSPVRRKGAAVVEFAIVLPVFVLIVLGTIESVSMIFVQQGVKIAAYEATRVALVNGTTSGEVQATADQILNDRGITNASLTVTPSDFQGSSYGTPITVSVDVSCDANSIVAPFFFSGRTMSASVCMMKEN
ncbi:MAG: TadE/TadG family type IV pilus assembly protein [Pirellulaceae bacterium]